MAKHRVLRQPCPIYSLKNWVIMDNQLVKLKQLYHTDYSQIVLLQAEFLRDFEKGKRNYRSVITKHYSTSTNLIHEELIIKTSLHFPQRLIPEVGE